MNLRAICFLTCCIFSHGLQGVLDRFGALTIWGNDPLHYLDTDLVNPLGLTHWLGDFLICEGFTYDSPAFFGHGGQGDVVKMHKSGTGEYALLKIARHKGGDADVQRECEIFRKLKDLSPNVLTCEASCKHKGRSIIALTPIVVGAQRATRSDWRLDVTFAVDDKADLKDYIESISWGEGHAAFVDSFAKLEDMIRQKRMTLQPSGHPPRHIQVMDNAGHILIGRHADHAAQERFNYDPKLAFPLLFSAKLHPVLLQGAAIDKAVRTTIETAWKMIGKGVTNRDQGTNILYDGYGNATFIDMALATQLDDHCIKLGENSCGSDLASFFEDILLKVPPSWWNYGTPSRAHRLFGEVAHITRTWDCSSLDACEIFHEVVQLVVPGSKSSPRSPPPCDCKASAVVKARTVSSNYLQYF